MIESGLGYLIAPFIAIGVAALLLGDSISKTRLVALAVIAATVIVLLLRSGELSHWVYLVIGATWGGYACLRKLTPLDAFAGLLVETMVLAVIWAVLLVATPITLVLPADIPLISITLLLLCGAVSVVPLWLFAHAATRLPLSVMGFFQFVLPITQLVVALTFYNQPMSVNTLVGFLVILAALLVTVAEPLWRFRTGVGR